MQLGLCAEMELVAGAALGLWAKMWAQNKRGGMIEPFASSGLKVQPHYGLSDVENPPSCPCPYMVTELMIGY
jgi:hypothetical protein